MGRKVSRDGGKTVYGWAIRFSEFMIEAEMHAVWQSPDGDYLDVTPPIVPLKRTDFIVDERLYYDGRTVDNIRINISGNPVVDDWIYLKACLNRVFAYGERTGEYTLEIPEALAGIIGTLEAIDRLFLLFLLEGGVETSTCFCGSRERYLKCHASVIRDSLAAEMDKIAVFMKD